MAEIRPLRAMRYDPDRVGDMAAVVAPPYDVIAPHVVPRLYARSPYNVVRLILNREVDPHLAAARELRAWRQQGVIVDDEVPGFYFYVQTFETARLGRRRRSGLLTIMRLEDFDTGRVRPHERTLEGPKANRLRLIKACQANLSPIFGLISRPGLVLRDLVAPAVERDPDVELTDDLEVRHQLWHITDLGVFERCAQAVKDEPVVIADGHHRYETALEFRREMRRAHPEAGEDAPFEFVLTCISNIEEPGMLILPTHRILPSARSREVKDAVVGLGNVFETTTYRPGERETFLAQLEGGAGQIGCVFPDMLVLLSLRGDPETFLPGRARVLQQLAVVLLHELVIPRLAPSAMRDLRFTHDHDDAFGAVQDGGAGVAFLVRAPTPHEVQAVCFAGETMPEKSTYFHPKLLAGLVFHSLAV